MAGEASEQARARARRCTRDAVKRAKWNAIADEHKATYVKFEKLAFEASQSGLPPELRMEL